MAKDDRIVVRMSAELREWVHNEASAREMDDAAYVRMVLAEARSGVAASRIRAEAPPIMMQPQPVRRDVLQLASSPDHLVEPDDMVEGTQPAAAAAIDVDALVAASLEEAEAAGLTEAQIDDAEGEMPEAGVRPLMRRPIPFSRGTQHARLEQMFGGQ